MSLNSMTRFASVGASLVLSLVSHAAIANPGSDPDVRQRVVRFADLDITRTEGVAVLYSRIANAARVVCEPESGMNEQRSLWLDAEDRKCQTQAIARGVDDVNAPALTSYYQLKQQSAR